MKSIIVLATCLAAVFATPVLISDGTSKLIDPCERFENEQVAKLYTEEQINECVFACAWSKGNFIKPDGTPDFDKYISVQGVDNETNETLRKLSQECVAKEGKNNCKVYQCFGGHAMPIIAAAAFSSVFNGHI